MRSITDAYPSMGSDLAFSIREWLSLSENRRKEVLASLHEKESFVCGRYLNNPQENCSSSNLVGNDVRSFCLWTQQGELQVECESLVWSGEEGQIGDWVALKLPSDLKTEKGNALKVRTAALKRLVPNLKTQDLKPAQEAQNLRLRRQFVEKVKALLIQVGLEEVETPYIVPCPGMEPTLEPFQLEWKWGADRRTFYLPTSPELHLKKMLAQGWTDIFEIKTCFRNSELSSTHEPEFLMLEWYRAFKDLKQIKTDLAFLLDGLYESGLIQGERPELKEVGYPDLFEEFAGFRLTPETTGLELEELCQKLQIDYSKTDSWDDLFFRISLEKIEPQLEAQGPLIVKDFPPSQAALARKTQEGWADRWEFYWRGLEIANAFHELNHPEEQRLRFEEDILKREALNTSPLKPDQDFLEHLEWGMPPAAGVALGVERLLMACQKGSELKKYRAFSFY